MKKKLSVLIPCYNADSTISNTLESLVSQTYSIYEIIIVNDGSTDSTKEMLLNYESKYENIKVFNNSNHGVSYSRNFALKKSCGDYISFVDADDTLDKDFYAKMMKNINDEVLVGSQIRKIKIGNKIELINNNSYNNVKKFINDLLIGDIDGYCVRFIFNKKLMENIFFDEKLTYMEDTHFLLNYVTKSNIKRIYFIDTYYNYYQQSNSITNKKGIVDKTIKNIKKSLDEIFNLNSIKNDSESRKIKINRKLKLYESQIYKIDDKQEFERVQKDEEISKEIKELISFKNTSLIYKIFYGFFLKTPYAFFIVYKYLRKCIRKVMK